ncbi:hypothetical protein FHS61_002397 [Altererythrobacter atlanticus]|uniref:Quercetin 2,3-dioxygenase n=1 Tax=Croceibacterium atlanticum TaxID=1267766 RepID=A0A0F7KR42_9SPHN|nr:pirin family protein [Croceibacterium atlanticum]AKH42069.1 Quercetin 2,3-dioxygenase [Croceibacterium atlanticum]MBB5733362.1 hypothetical protein [Croceibacterium atlanticum]
MSILKTVTPVTHDLGNFQVRRAVPSVGCRMVGPFVFIDQFGPARLDPGQGMDVRPHPHIGLATVTWLFEGAIEHRDSLGTDSVIRPGTVNLMTAGKGIVHSERSPETERKDGPALYGMQTWLALPDGKEEIEPAFEAVSDLPVIEYSGARARIIMGTLWGETAPTTTYCDTINAEIQLMPGGMIPIDAETEERALMLVGGQATLDGETMLPYDLVVLKPGAAMELSSTEGGLIFLMGGEAFSAQRHVYWNFVSSSRDRIEQAKEDWRMRRFPVVPGDDKEFIPLPKTPKTVSYP